MEEYMIPCLMKTFFGVPCPGCGGQRSVLHLLHGEFGEAFLMYPAIYPLLLMGLLILTNYLFPFRKYSDYVSTISMISVVFILLNYGYELSMHFNLF